VTADPPDSAPIETPKSFRLFSVLLVEERIREAAYFARRLRRQSNPSTVGYELNAFLSAARSVTFLLQKELKGVPGFTEWWHTQRERLRDDQAARFFLELRNFSQKEGRIATVGSRSSRTGRWRFLFAGTSERVPPELLGRDIADCCKEHLAKLGSVVLDGSKAFPFHSCPTLALTDAGVEALGIDLDTVDVSLGYPRGWTNVGGPDERSRRISVLRMQVDAVDFAFVRRIAKYRVPRSEPGSDFGSSFGASLAAEIERSRAKGEGCGQALRNGLVGEIMRSELHKK
jgi:hypothetical protein